MANKNYLYCVYYSALHRVVVPLGYSAVEVIPDKTQALAFAEDVRRRTKRKKVKFIDFTKDQEKGGSVILHDADSDKDILVVEKERFGHSW